MKIIGILLLWSTWSLTAADPSLVLIKTIPLPGVKGRFDHFAMDTNGHRLFVAALGNDSLEVLDVAEGKHRKSITGLRKPTGVLFLPVENQIAVAAGEEGALKFFDGRNYTQLKSVGSLDDADNVRFDANAKVIYVGYGDGALALIDAVSAKTVGSIPLAAHPESFQLERQGNRIFVNVPDARQIAVIDRDQRKVVATWPVKEFQANFPLALDEAKQRLMVGCRKPARLLVLNTTDGKRVADVALSGDTDDLFFDAARARLYVSCGEGFIDVVEQREADHYVVRERIPTRSGARTSFYSPELNEFYLAVPQRGQESAEIRIYRPGK